MVKKIFAWCFVYQHLWLRLNWPFLPLMKKDGLAEKAREIIDDLKFDFNCQYDEKDSIGKRYRRPGCYRNAFLRDC